MNFNPKIQWLTLNVYNWPDNGAIKPVKYSTIQQQRPFSDYFSLCEMCCKFIYEELLMK